MSFEHDPAECLEDILDNIARIEGYLAGFTSEMFEDDVGLAMPRSGASNASAKRYFVSGREPIS
jgi:hypothetical protein